jgi:Mor family transcriptional regulator
MSYRRAEEILLMEIIELIQNYVDGVNIYIPRKESQRKEWGTNTSTRKELEDRNIKIFTDYQKGYNVQDLSKKYFLSIKSIERILREMK